MKKQMNLDPSGFGTVGVFLGGRSRERAISLRSGRAVCAALNTSGVKAVPLDPAKGLAVQLRRFPIDLAFIALHGRGGEDGEIQSVLESRGIAFVGSDSEAGELAFDKVRAKSAFESFGIPTPSHSVLNGRNWDEVLQKWRPPFVVKPVDEGSSIGVAMIEQWTRSNRGKIKRYLARYGELLVEQKIEGREFTVGILGHEALPVIELKPKRAFYDYRAKYTKGLTDYLVPAPISASLTRTLQALALKAHHALGLRDLSRVDILVDRQSNPFVLEANSIPGFTETSLLPKAARCAGLGFEDLCLKLLTFAAERKKPQVEVSVSTENQRGNGMVSTLW